jgi:PKHD-type hydroxylase
MMLQIPDVLAQDQVSQVRKLLGEAQWTDGSATAGAQAGRVKNNSEVPKDHPSAQKAAEIVRASLASNKLFAMTAMPLKISTPLFNRYRDGQAYGPHVDNALRPASGGAGLMRGDLSATLFLTAPEEYDGGELSVEDTFGVHNAKLPAGHLVLYPAGSLHQVKPVTRGTRLASFLWIQSLVRDEGHRSILLEMDMAVQQLHRDHPQHPSTAPLVGLYHNLLRRWTDL